MIRNINIAISCSLILLFSCSRKLIAPGIEKVERKKTSELLNCLDSLNKQSLNTFYTKIATKFKDTTQNLSFKTSIRLVKDSAVNALITYASFPIFNSLLTKDSLLLVNKRSKCYIKTNLSFIKENFGIDFNYRNVEELLLGLPLGFDDDQKYFQIHNPFDYIISSHRKREIKRSDKKEKFQDDIILQYFLNNQLNGLKKLIIESKEDSAKVVINYNKWVIVNERNFPEEMFIEIFTPRNHMEINLAYDKIQVNEPQQIIVVIPEEYEICE